MKQPGQLHLHRGGSDDKSGGERDVKKEKEEKPHLSQLGDTSNTIL